MTKSVVVLLGAMGVWGLLTAHRVPAFASDRALWASAAEVAPLLPRPHVNLCVALGNTGELDAAWAECSTAVGLTFDVRRNRYRSATERASAQGAQAMVAAFMGHLDAADRMLTQVEAAWPNHPALPGYRSALDKRMGKE